MKKALIIFVLIIFQCKKDTSYKKLVTIAGSIIAIQFDVQNIKTLKEGDFVIINKNKFIHKNNFIGNSQKNILPVFKTILHEIERKTLKEEINIISLALILAKELKRIKEYEFINFTQTYVNGVITIRRKDKKTIKITKETSYPLIINVIKP